MPLLDVGGVRLAYDTYGPSGPWVVLVTGLGYGRWAWDNQIEPFTRAGFRLLTLDNRGVGESDVPDGPYTVAQMAQEVLGLMDALGIERAHLVGHSLGGFITIELALAAPQRVDRLVLCATAMGGPEFVPPPEETLRMMTDIAGLTPEQLLRRNMPYSFSPGYTDRHPEVLEKYVAIRLAQPTDPRGYLGQLQASATFDASKRVQAIEAQTLVVHGNQDRVANPANAAPLAAAVPTARLVILEGVGHSLFIEATERMNDLVLGFLTKGSVGEADEGGGG